MLLIIITLGSLLYQHHKHEEYVTVSSFLVWMDEGQYWSVGFEKMIVFVIRTWLDHSSAWLNELLNCNW
jgi:hypothetical protein